MNTFTWFSEKSRFTIKAFKATGMLAMVTPLTAADIARLVRAGDQEVIEQICRQPLFIKNDNFVVRPWGGQRLFSYKGLEHPQDMLPYGESFEVAACTTDEEARRYPSLVQFADGSTMPLNELLTIAGSLLLGDDFVTRYGTEIPLLPKILHIKQLLSLQTHPVGNTEAYIIIDAEPGATLYLGFNTSLDKDALRHSLQQAHEVQAHFVKRIRPDADQTALYELLLPYFTNTVDRVNITDTVAPFLKETITASDLQILEDMKAYYQYFLSLMNKIPVQAGDIIYNANPERAVASGDMPSAEIHALGNPDNKEILALEIRRPGATYRLWDNVRLPQRELSLDKALETLSGTMTQPEDFFVVRQTTRVLGVYRSIESTTSIVDHIIPTHEISPEIRGDGQFHILHLIEGRVVITVNGASYIIERGQTVIMPAHITSYRVFCAGPEPAELIKMSIPAGTKAVLPFETK